MPPEKFVREGHTLDTEHYLLTQFYPPLKQLTEMHLPMLDRKVHLILEQRAIKLEMEAQGQSDNLDFFCRKRVSEKIKGEATDKQSKSMEEQVAEHLVEQAVTEMLSTRILESIVKLESDEQGDDYDYGMEESMRRERGDAVIAAREVMKSAMWNKLGIFAPIPSEEIVIAAPKLKRPRINLSDLGLRANA
jgi:hypothetical protein